MFCKNFKFLYGLINKLTQRSLYIFSVFKHSVIRIKY